MEITRFASFCMEGKFFVEDGMKTMTMSELRKYVQERDRKAGKPDGV